MLDFDSEDIDSMHNDAGEEQEPPPTGHWTATSSYDIYMVDTPKENNGKDQKDATEDNPPEKQPKRRGRRRRSKPRSKRRIILLRNSTPDDAENKNNPTQPCFELAGREDGQASPNE